MLVVVLKEKMNKPTKQTNKKEKKRKKRIFRKKLDSQISLSLLSSPIWGETGQIKSGKKNHPQNSEAQLTLARVSCMLAEHPGGWGWGGSVQHPTPISTLGKIRSTKPVRLQGPSCGTLDVGPVGRQPHFPATFQHLLAFPKYGTCLNASDKGVRASWKATGPPASGRPKKIPPFKLSGNQIHSVF